MHSIFFMYLMQWEKTKVSLLHFLLFDTWLINLSYMIYFLQLFLLCCHRCWNDTVFFAHLIVVQETGKQKSNLLPLTLSHTVTWFYKNMAFGDLLEQVGSAGRFQVLHVTLLCIPVLLMASHNLLQNFVAAVPHHHCSAHSNLSQTQLSAQERLLITVPIDQTGKPHKCQRYAAPQWHLLDKNGTSNSLEQGDSLDLQECIDGWSYNMTEMSSTIISDVGLFISF